MIRPVRQELDPSRADPEALIVDVEGFEGPLDVLLSLARDQKVDLARISVLQLVEQYAEFVQNTKSLRIELAADYLVMAAWLALLKSRLLVPETNEDSRSEDELAAFLKFRLLKLQAMRTAAERLMERDRLGQQFFQRGDPEDVQVEVKHEFSATVLDLMRAYARLRTRDSFRPQFLERPDILPIEEAFKHLNGLLGSAIEWSDLAEFLPRSWLGSSESIKSAKASLFAASLELARMGDLELRQRSPFSPVQLKKRQVANETEH